MLSLKLMRCVRRPVVRERTLSIWAWAILICHRRPMSSKSCAKSRKSPMPMAIRRPEVFPGSVRRRPIIMRAALVLMLIPKPKSSLQWVRKRASRASQPPSLRRVTSSWRRTQATRYTRSVSSSRVRPFGPYPRRLMKIISGRWSARWRSQCRGRRSLWSIIRPTRPRKPSIWLFTNGWSLGRKTTRSGYCPILLIQNSILTATRPHRFCR